MELWAKDITSLHLCLLRKNTLAKIIRKTENNLYYHNLFIYIYIYLFLRLLFPLSNYYNKYKFSEKIRKCENERRMPILPREILHNFFCFLNLLANFTSLILRYHFHTLWSFFWNSFLHPFTHEFLNVKHFQTYTNAFQIFVTWFII